ncbi:hypothetical protein VaNZ11_007579 [Volvox africanus]|uniref:BTB domain-containing protein n=1 Tax=Volvox africanus TaxID=51714 RepID=A0ABQ5S4Z2_9CHLO|nr:hypothetical protein VaNZ11_007579 [Volvox africanus]
MDKLFLSGLLKKNPSKREARHEDESLPQAPYSPRSALSGSTGLAGGAPWTGNGAVVSAPYAGRTLEQLLFDATSCDLVILVADELNYSRALPAHKEVLRSRNTGGYFGKLLAQPQSFPEYSDKPAGPGSDVAAGLLASKPMIRRMHWPWQLASALLSFIYRDYCEVAWEGLPELRRLGEEVGARGLCEAVDYLLDPQHLLPWTVTDMRAAAVALKRHQLVEAADRYAAALSASGMGDTTRMATVIYHARQSRPKVAMSTSAPPSLPSSDGAVNPPGLPPLHSQTSVTAGRDSFLLRAPSFRTNATALSSSSSFSSRNNSLPALSLSVPNGYATANSSGGSAGSGGNGGSSTIADGSGGSGSSGSSSSYYKDGRIGIDIVDGVLRSVALDSKVLRGLVLPGRRRDNVLLCAVSTGGVVVGGSGGSMGSPSGRRPSGATMSDANAAQFRTSSPYSAVVANRSNGGGGGGAAAAATLPARQPTELLPQVSSRLRSAMGSPQAGSVSSTGLVTHGSALQGGFGSNTGFCVSKSTSSTTYGVEEQSPEATSSTSSFPLALMVIVPAVHLAASLASLVQRPLDTHVPGYIGPTIPGVNGLIGINVLNGSVAGGQGSLGSPGSGAGRKDSGWIDSNTNGNSNYLNNINHHSLSTSSSSSFDPFSKLSGVPGLTWSSNRATMAFNGTHGSVGTTATCASLLQQLPAASSLGDYDQLSLALGLDWAASITQTGYTAYGGSGSGTGGTADGAFSSSGSGYGSGSFTGAPTIAAAAAAVAAVGAAGGSGDGGGGFSASRLLGIVLSTLSAAEHPQYIVRMDSTQAANAVAFERRRAAADVSSLNSLAGSIAGSNGFCGGGGGGGSGVGVSSSCVGFSTASAFAAVANTVKAVVGPANPREYFIPLPDNPTGAVTITLPVGLVLVDAATLESVSGSPCNNIAAGYGGGGGAIHAFGLRSAADGGLLGGYGSGGGSSACTSARVAALMPHLLASASALSHIISAVGLISQILRVAGEQHGLYSVPALRACLRVFNPSTALLATLIQTNTSFAVSTLENTIYIRKSLSDILRLLQAILSTLPFKSYGNHGNGGSNGGPSCTGSVSGGSSGCSETISRARLTSGDSFTGSLSRQGSRQRSNRSLDARASTASGCSVSGMAPASAPPIIMPSSSSFILSFPPSRRVTTSDLNLRPVSSLGGTPYAYGVPYNQLERLFPGWSLHVMELSSPGTLLLDEF